MSLILIVDDKELMRDAVGTMLTRAGWSVLSAGDGKTAIKYIAERKPDVVLTDLKMPGMTGLELLSEIRQVDEHLPVVLMTAYATVQTAVQAMKLGAYDYITKPFEGEQLVLTIGRAVERAALLKENAVLKTQNDYSSKRKIVPQLIGDSQSMNALKAKITLLAQNHSTILITGESGSGKEVVAQTIHNISPRAHAPLLALNCAALSASLLESELFGHERGAFTGADKLRKGRFELAEGGTLLLDEITEIPPQIQAKLLRVLQEQAFERVGSSVTQHSDVRVIATTNRNLSDAVARGDFRQDLYFRLHVLPLEVPPLRAHCDDIPLLCEYFMNGLSQSDGVQIKQFSQNAINLLKSYHWPGNVRELYNICERARIFSQESIISSQIIRPWLTEPKTNTVSQTSVQQKNNHNNNHLAYSDNNLQRWATTEYDEQPYELPQPYINNNSPATDTEILSGTDNNSSQFSLPQNATDDEYNFNDVPETVNDELHKVVVKTCSLNNRDVRIEASGRTLEDIERELIVATLERNSRHRQRTATELGIGVRTLGLKLRKWKELRLVSQDL